MNRVVITGLGIVAPNGVEIAEFISAIQSGRSGIRYDQQLADLKFSCQISGKPELSQQKISENFTDLELRNFNSTGIMYGVIAALDAWRDAGLVVVDENTDWESGTIFG